MYLTTDAEGDTGVGYVATAGGAKVPLIADSARAAQALRPIVERYARMTGRSYILARFGRREDLATIGPLPDGR